MSLCDCHTTTIYGTCAHFGIIWQFELNDLIGSYELTFLNNEAGEMDILASVGAFTKNHYHPRTLHE